MSESHDADNAKKVVHRNENVLYTDFAQTHADSDASGSKNRTRRTRATGLGEFHWGGQIIMNYLQDHSDTNRTKRGLELFREGKVQQLDMLEQEVSAWVVGTQLEPFSTSMGFAPLTDTQKEFLTAELKADDSNIYTILSGGSDSYVDNLLLSPASITYMQCDCPDFASRGLACKHLVGMGYAAASALTASPEAILLWRGITDLELIERVRFLDSRRGGSKNTQVVLGSLGSETKKQDPSSAEPPTDFWGDGISYAPIPEFTHKSALEYGDTQLLNKALSTQTFSSNVELLILKDELDTLYSILMKEP